MAFRILSIDGGGVRGIFAAKLLSRLNASLQRDGINLLDHVDLFAGTSTGALIALALASGKDISDITDAYSTHTKQIFSHRPLSIGGWMQSKYSQDNLRSAIEKMVGIKELRALRYVVVPALELSTHRDNIPVPTNKVSAARWRPVLFHNLPGSKCLDRNTLDVALMSSAAPTFFPSHQGHIDGGVFANNPALAAVSMAVDPRYGNQPLCDVQVLSISTGRFLKAYKTNVDWGKLRWARPLLEILLEASSVHAHDQCAAILGNRYHRLEHHLGANNIQLDDADRVQELLKLAGEDALNPSIEEAVNFVKDNFIPKEPAPARPSKAQGREFRLINVIDSSGFCNSTRIYRGVMTGNSVQSTEIRWNFPDPRDERQVILKRQFTCHRGSAKLKEQNRLPSNQYFAQIELPEAGDFDFKFEFLLDGAFARNADEFNARWHLDDQEEINKKDRKGIKTDYFEWQAHINFECTEFVFLWSSTPEVCFCGPPRAYIKQLRTDGHFTEIAAGPQWDPSNWILSLRDVLDGLTIRIEWDVAPLAASTPSLAKE